MLEILTDLSATKQRKPAYILNIYYAVFNNYVIVLYLPQVSEYV